MNRILAVTSIAGVVSVATVLAAGCVADDNAAPPATGVDAGHVDATFPDAGPLPDTSTPLPDVATADVATGDAADAADAGPTFATPTSCTDAGSTGALHTCGEHKDGDCCAHALVQGGTFYREYNGVTLTDKSHPATLSDFALDTYEITVARFRAYVAAGMGTQVHPPVAGSGAHPKIAGSGWDPSWSANLPADTAALVSGLKSCGGAVHYWTDAPDTSENKPVNCMSWYQAFAFCAWDHGRLPTIAEHSYAATGGSEQRFYPWSSATDAGDLDHTFASFGCWEGTDPGDPKVDGGACSASNVFVAGSFPRGNARWGHSDLSGNLWEWSLDWYIGYVDPCTDCATAFLEAGTDASGYYRTLGGGSFEGNTDEMNSFSATPNYPDGNGLDYYGVRCVRLP